MTVFPYIDDRPIAEEYEYEECRRSLHHYSYSGRLLGSLVCLGKGPHYFAPFYLKNSAGEFNWIVYFTDGHGAICGLQLWRDQINIRNIAFKILFFWILKWLQKCYCIFWLWWDSQRSSPKEFWVEIGKFVASLSIFRYTQTDSLLSLSLTYLIAKCYLDYFEYFC